jgi:hypothetical protein
LGSVPFFFFFFFFFFFRVCLYASGDAVAQRKSDLMIPRFFEKISLFWREKWNFLNEKG